MLFGLLLGSVFGRPPSCGAAAIPSVFELGEDEQKAVYRFVAGL